MYRDDDVARAARANTLISEIATLERQKVEQVSTDKRLEAAREELRTLQAAATIATPKPTERTPSLGVHLFVFAATAGATYLGYTLFLAG